MSETAAAAKIEAKRRSKFLVVVDDTPEVRIAVRYATRRARNIRCGVVMLRVVEPVDFQQWAGVADIMREEAHDAAEALLQKLAEQVNQESGIMPELVIREGIAREEILKLIEEEPEIRMLVLAAAPESEGPGPLVAAFSQMAGTLKFPITILPGNLTDEQIDRLT
ncbi:universal stress protein [uncultured Ferrovibrio sp.]|jgi:nucleotide-binding universal stress UspA family protein|uniref:universal stress protein n=1 Tax=uncultured Ferrovibrio sp. TaxID=1576913 RepID=UPI00261581F7|nr:universal stress protein [uncultured Ferrovibrio sp.]